MSRSSGRKISRTPTSAQVSAMSSSASDSSGRSPAVSITISSRRPSGSSRVPSAARVEPSSSSSALAAPGRARPRPRQIGADREQGRALARAARPPPPPRQAEIQRAVDRACGRSPATARGGSARRGTARANRVVEVEVGIERDLGSRAVEPTDRCGSRRCLLALLQHRRVREVEPAHLKVGLAQRSTFAGDQAAGGDVSSTTVDIGQLHAGAVDAVVVGVARRT
jgi:hypothetical protein